MRGTAPERKPPARRFFILEIDDQTATELTLFSRCAETDRHAAGFAGSNSRGQLRDDQRRCQLHIQNFEQFGT